MGLRALTAPLRRPPRGFASPHLNAFYQAVDAFFPLGFPLIAIATSLPHPWLRPRGHTIAQYFSVPDPATYRASPSTARAACDIAPPQARGMLAAFLAVVPTLESSLRLLTLVCR